MKLKTLAALSLYLPVLAIAAPINEPEQRAGSHIELTTSPQTSGSAPEGEPVTLSLTSFPSRKAKPCATSSTVGQPGNATASVQIVKGPETCKAEDWAYATTQIDRRSNGGAMAKVQLENTASAIVVTGGEGHGFGQAYSGIRFSGPALAKGTIECAIVEASGDAISAENTYRGPKTITCALGELKPGTLQVGPVARISATAKLNGRLAVVASASVDTISIEYVAAPPAVDKFKEAGAELACLAPVIEKPNEKQNFTKGPILVKLKPPSKPQTSPFGPKQQVRVYVNRYDSQTDQVFYLDMPIDGTEDITSRMGAKPGGTFEPGSSATYRISAFTHVDEASTCKPRADRIFSITAPRATRPIAGPDTNQRDERMPNPTAPPPVESAPADEAIRQGR